LERNQVSNVDPKSSGKEDHFKIGNSTDSSLDLGHRLPTYLEAQNVAAASQILLGELLLCPLFLDLWTDCIPDYWFSHGTPASHFSVAKMES